jgi:hypothetical protein
VVDFEKRIQRQRTKRDAESSAARAIAITVAHGLQPRHGMS